MDFLKKSRTYVVQYGKREAIKRLKEDDRVEIISTKLNLMIIQTKPLRTDKAFYHQLDLKPTGTYRITIKYFPLHKRLRIKMVRIEGGVSSIQSYSRHHNHIDGSDEFDRVCFGSAQTEINKINDNKDWYWAGVMCLNLLEDFTDHNMTTIYAIEHMVRAQIDFTNDVKFEKFIKQKTSAVIKRSKRLTDEYFIYGDKFFMEVHCRRTRNGKHKRKSS